MSKLSIVLIVIFLTFPLASALTYDSTSNNISLNYDALNRISAKTTSTNNYTYSYDKQYPNTLTNISANNYAVQYTYDKKLRMAKETRTIDGIQFEKQYLYDSADRLISQDINGQSIGYVLNSQNKIQSLPDYIPDSHYSSFGSILNRTYANNLITTFSYDSQNNRLTNIITPAVQNLSYTYDSVGNILTLNDQINGKLHSLTYDNLNRLTGANIGPDRYVYSYDALGRMLKIVNNNQSKKFIYNGNQTHAPSQVIDSAAGIDVYGLKDISNNTRNRTFEFYLINDKNTTLSEANYTLNSGNNNSFTNTSLNLTNYTKATITINYSSGGNYLLNLTGQAPGSTDFQYLSTKFGVVANKLQKLSSNISVNLFEFEIHNNIVENVSGINWNCSENIVPGYTVGLSGNQSLFSYIMINYSVPGSKTFSCAVSSADGNDTKSLPFALKGQEIENYDVLYRNISRRIVAFKVKNYFIPTATNISMTAEGSTFSKNTTLAADEKIMVFAEVNYSSDNYKNFSIMVSSANYSQNYLDVFKLEGASIENYLRVPNGTQQVIAFELRNNWFSGVLYWNLSNPALSNSSALDNNQTLMVMVQSNYNLQNDSSIDLNAYVSSFVDIVKDYLKIRPLELISLETLAEGRNAVSEIVARNNLDASQQFSWKFNTGIENITSSNLTPINFSDVFIYIASNYSTDRVYKTTAFINSSDYSDNATGVILS